VSVVLGEGVISLSLEKLQNDEGSSSRFKDNSPSTQYPFSTVEVSALTSPCTSPPQQSSIFELVYIFSRVLYSFSVSNKTDSVTPLSEVIKSQSFELQPSSAEDVELVVLVEGAESTASKNGLIVAGSDSSKIKKRSLFWKNIKEALQYSNDYYYFEN